MEIIKGFKENKQNKFIITDKGLIESHEAQIMKLWHFWSVSYKPSKYKEDGYTVFMFNKSHHPKIFEGEIDAIIKRI